MPIPDEVYRGGVVSLGDGRYAFPVQLRLSDAIALPLNLPNFSGTPPILGDAFTFALDELQTPKQFGAVRAVQLSARWEIGGTPPLDWPPLLIYCLNSKQLIALQPDTISGDVATLSNSAYLTAQLPLAASTNEQIQLILVKLPAIAPLANHVTLWVTFLNYEVQPYVYSGKPGIPA
jgi:hypothetical protein